MYAVVWIVLSGSDEDVTFPSHCWPRLEREREWYVCALFIYGVLCRVRVSAM